MTNKIYKNIFNDLVIYKDLVYWKRMYIDIILENSTNLTEFYKNINKYINDNIFIDIFIKKELNIIIDNILKIQWLCKKYIYIWRSFFKFKKAKVINKTDLLFNDINKDENIIFHYENPSSIYKFSCDDIVNILINNLTYSDNQFPAPLQIKNPYTRHILSKTDLYNIYIYYCIVTKKTQKKVNWFIKDFAKYNFCLYKIKQIHGSYLISLAIKEDIKGLNNNLYISECEYILFKYIPIYVSRKIDEFILNKTFSKNDYIIQLNEYKFDLHRVPIRDLRKYFNVVLCENCNISHQIFNDSDFKEKEFNNYSLVKDFLDTYGEIITNKKSFQKKK